MKVLIISHNPISSYQNMGKTMLSLFSSFEKAELCQLYIYPSDPDVDKCNSYLRISDVDALKGIFKFHVHPVAVQPSHKLYERNKSAVYGKDWNRNHSRELLRDIVWKISPWWNQELRDWLLKEQPTHIFVAPGRGKFLYDIALKISGFLNAPVLTYICDDYYNLKNETGFFGKIWQKGLRKKIKELVENSKCVLTICDELAEIYKEEFRCETKTCMTGAGFEMKQAAPQTGKITSLVFMGNISLNRYQSLIEVADVLKKISSEGQDCYLDVYTGDSSKEILDACAGHENLRLHGFVTGDEYKQIFENAEAFVHVEAFDELSINRVKHSFSTKIPDILASGKPVLAYGPLEVASIGHLMRNQAGCIVTDKNYLETEILKFMEDAGCRESIIEKELETAERFHNEKKNSIDFKELFAKESI